ncbi:hypothetical protein EAF04_009506 [Stromatinia cepivora]|nr:hypothetical protein EAF04_009506 [Stromatinia cepivora]
MAIFNSIRYSYVPTAPRFKSATLRKIPAQEKLNTPNKIVIDYDESYRSQIRVEIDIVCDAKHHLELFVDSLRSTTTQKNIGLEDSGWGNTSWEDETTSYPKDGCSPFGKNESVPLLHKELMDRPGNDRSTQDRPLILKDDESNLSDSESSFPADSVPELSKQDRPTGQEV